MKKIAKLSVGAILTLSATGSLAAGFQLAEVSTSGLGASYAGNAAVAENASVVATNPALMMEFNRLELSVGGIYIDAEVDVDGKLGKEDASNQNIVPNAFVPNFYAIMPLNERFSIGGGVNTNYGLKTQFDKDYVAGAFGGMTDLKTVNFNLSGAAKLGYGFSFGLGVNAIKADAKLERYAGSLPQVLSQKLTQAQKMLQSSSKPADQKTAAFLGKVAGIAAQTPATATIKHLEGDTWGYGWNAGLSYTLNENHRFGLAYHSKVKLDFKGQFSNQLPLALNGIALPQLAALKPATGGENRAAKLSVTLPAFWELSSYHRLTDKLALQASWKYTQWSVFEELKGTVGNDVALQKDEKFSNSSRYALGLSYDATEFLTLRTGIAYEESASKNHPSVSIPDTNRTWLSLGATYKFTPNLTTDLGYAYVYGHKNDFIEEGKLFAKSRSHVNLFGLNVNYKF